MLAALILAAVVSPVIAPTWVQVFFVCCTGAVLFAMLGAFVHFARKDPDALRSESFGLSKLRIERGLVGDSRAGLREIHATERFAIGGAVVQPDGEESG